MENYVRSDPPKRPEKYIYPCELEYLAYSLAKKSLIVSMASCQVKDCTQLEVKS
jgi:hypothetical protein